MELQLAGLFGLGGDQMGGRGSPKGATGLEPASSTCGRVGSLGDSGAGVCDSGIDDSFTREGHIGGSGGGGNSAP